MNFNMETVLTKQGNDIINKLIEAFKSEMDISINKHLGVYKKLYMGNSKTTALISVLDDIMEVSYYDYDRIPEKNRMRIGSSHTKSFKIINKRNILFIETPKIEAEVIEYNRRKEKLFTFAIIGKDAYKIYYSLLKRANELLKCNHYSHGVCVYSKKNGYTLPVKNKENIFIPGVNNLFDDINQYLDNTSLIESMNINSTLGILLYGEPGTGKSTLISRIAYDYNQKMIGKRLGFYCSWIRIDLSRESITKAICEYDGEGDHFGIILEEIDCVSLERKNNNHTDGRQERTSLSELLVWLDNPGVNVAMVIATTNHIENLDPALIREGRFDIKFECPNINKPLASKMVKSFGLSTRTILRDETYPINPAYLQSKCLKKLKNNGIKERK